LGCISPSREWLFTPMSDIDENPPDMTTSEESPSFASDVDP
jgi:hypothetical protein